MRKAQVAFAFISIVTAVLGLAFLVLGLSENSSAPQQAALAAVTLAGVVPFYVVARCVEMLYGAKR